MRSLYRIEHYMEAPLDRWAKNVSFDCMQKSFAMGAWAMLKAHYNHSRRHRLVKDNEVIEEMGLQTIVVNSEKREQ